MVTIRNPFGQSKYTSHRDSASLWLTHRFTIGFIAINALGCKKDPGWNCYWEVTNVTSPRGARDSKRTKLKLEFKTNQATIIWFCTVRSEYMCTLEYAWNICTLSRLLTLTYRESSQGAELLGLNCSGSNQLAVKSYLHARQVVQESRQLPL